MALIYQDKIPVKYRSEAVKKIIAIATKRGFSPDALSIVIWKESKWNPTAQNTLSNATGLIQWLPSTAKSLYGLSVQEIKKLDILQQIDLIDRYYVQPYLINKGFKSFFDVYFAVFHPDLMGRPDSFEFASTGSLRYSQNKGLDIDKDGIITVKNIKDWFKKDVPDLEIVYEKSKPYIWLITLFFILVLVAWVAFKKKWFKIN